MKRAKYWVRNESGIMCKLCPHSCQITEGKTGICRVRRNIEGVLYAESYGKISSIALDPIEKKPLRNFCPGSNILSVGSYGCNFRCGFCQNYHISMKESLNDPECRELFPEELASLSLQYKQMGNIGIAYTYNEPLVGFEYVEDSAKLIKAQGQKNALVTNGFISEEPLKELLPLIDAMNIDLKAFSAEFYQKVGGDLEAVKRTIALAAQHCHVEVTTLVIEGENDSLQEMEALAQWLSGMNKDIPLHISRFFPTYQYGQRSPTPVKTVHQLVDKAGEYLNHVYAGNC